MFRNTLFQLLLLQVSCDQGSSVIADYWWQRFYSPAGHFILALFRLFKEATFRLFSFCSWLMSNGVDFCPFTIYRSLQYFNVRWWLLKKISSFLMIEFFSNIFYVLFMDYLELLSGLLELWWTLEADSNFEIWQTQKAPKTKEGQFETALDLIRLSALKKTWALIVITSVCFRK